MLLQKRAGKSLRRQVLLKGGCQLGQSRPSVVVAHRLTRRLPDRLLRIELRRTGGKPHNLQTRVRLKNRPDSRAAVPRSPIPQQQDRAIRIRQHKPLQEQSRHFSVHQIRAQDDLLATVQVECPVEVSGIAPRIGFDHRSQSHRRPYPLQGRLQIQPRFVASQYHGVRRTLRRVHQLFFPSPPRRPCSWPQSATCIPLRDADSSVHTS